MWRPTEADPLQTRNGSESLTNGDLTRLKALVAKGTAVLVGRQLALRVLGFVGSVILARILAPQEFGIFAIAAFIVSFLSTVGNVGLGAALIQRKGELAEDDIQTVFTIQQGTFTVLFLFIFVLSPGLRTFYPDLPAGSEWLVRALGLSLLITSFRTVPTIILERDLAYTKIATIEVAEVLTYQFTAVGLAAFGFGIWSLVWASILRALAGVAVIFRYVRWRPRLRVSVQKAKTLLKFGIPYQLNSLLSMLTEAVIPSLVAAVSGAAAVGYLNLAKNSSHLPIRVVTDSFGQAAYPAFSKIQDDKESLREFVTKSTNILSLVMIPVSLFMVALGPELIQTIYGTKWLPALNSFYLYMTIPFIIPYALPPYIAIVSLGKASLILYLNTALAILQWGLCSILVSIYGYVGVPMAQPVIGMILQILYLEILKKNGVYIELKSLRFFHIVVGAFCVVILILIKNLFSTRIISLAFLFISALTVYVFLIFLFSRSQFMELFEFVKMKVLGVSA
jgi:O-antigen/teichoic acid export membrane protein